MMGQRLSVTSNVLIRISDNGTGPFRDPHRGVIMAVKIDKETCIGCGACVGTCPVGALTMVDGKSVVDPAVCVDCGACVAVCPVQAMSL